MLICHVNFGRKLFITSILRRTAHGERERRRGSARYYVESVERWEAVSGTWKFSYERQENHRLLLCEESWRKTITSWMKLPMGHGDRLAFCMTVILYSWDVRDICASWLIWMKICITFKPLEFTLHGVYVSVYMHLSVLCNTRLSDQQVHTGVLHLETLKTLVVFGKKTVCKWFEWVLFQLFCE